MTASISLVCGQLFSSLFFFDFHRTNFSGFRRTFHQFRSGWLCYFCYFGLHPVQVSALRIPQLAIKKEIAKTTADKTIPDTEKKELLQELNQALKSAEPIQFSGNVELVQKYYDKIDAMTIATYDADRLSTSTVVRTINE